MNKQRSKAFTLVELLVVIAIIAILMGILMPALGRARKQAKKLYCKTNLKNIHLAMVMYAEDNDGKTHRSPNQGVWYKYRSTLKGKIRTTEMLDQDDSNAYWGIAYFPYCKKVDTFVCPSSKYMDDLGDYDNSDMYWDGTYGLNTYLSGHGKKKVLLTKRPSERILAQDHIEHFLDNNGDMLHIREDDNINLPQWRQETTSLSYNTAEHYPDPLGEIYRHAKSCNLLWLDGHISDVKESTGEDISEYWYTGD